MIPAIGIVVALYVATRCLDLLSADKHMAVRVFAGVTVVAAFAGIGLLIVAMQDANALLGALTP
jgi:hypothetical protein